MGWQNMQGICQGENASFPSRIAGCSIFFRREICTGAGASISSKFVRSGKETKRWQASCPLPTARFGYGFCIALLLHCGFFSVRLASPSPYCILSICSLSYNNESKNKQATIHGDLRHRVHHFAINQSDIPHRSTTDWKSRHRRLRHIRGLRPLHRLLRNRSIPNSGLTRRTNSPQVPDVNGQHLLPLTSGMTHIFFGVRSGNTAGGNASYKGRKFEEADRAARNKCV